MITNLNPWQPNGPGRDPDPGRFLYRFEAELDVVPIGIVPEGIRMANTFDGTVTTGEFEGARVWGIDHFILRRDGVGIVDAPKTISGQAISGRPLRGEGFHLFEHIRAYSLPPAEVEMPPLEAILEPDFEWPDILFPIQGFSTFRAAQPELAHLNRAIARIDGWVDFTTGRLAVETTLVDHRKAVAGPGRVRDAA